MRCCTWQWERGESGTLHAQGYVVFKSGKTFASVKKILPGANIQARRGTDEQAWEYASKEDTRVGVGETFGVRLEQGKRNDLLVVKRKLDEGTSMKDIAQEHFKEFCRYERSFRAYKRLVQSPTKPTTDVCLIYGPTGTGKSHFLLTEYPKAYWKQNSIWWDDYEGQETVVVDEFYGWLPYTDFLRVCDKYPLLCQTKGGQVRAKFKRIFFTSNSLPKTWYDWDKEHINWAPFVRRFTSFMYFKSMETHMYFDNYIEFIKAVN